MKLLCDACHTPIRYLDDGWVEWLSTDPQTILTGFRIVHHDAVKAGCPYWTSRLPENTYAEDHHLSWFVQAIQHDPEVIDELFADLVFGDPDFRPVSTCERIRGAARLPYRPVARTR